MSSARRLSRSLLERLRETVNPLDDQVFAADEMADWLLKDEA